MNSIPQVVKSTTMNSTLAVGTDQNIGTTIDATYYRDYRTTDIRLIKAEVDPPTSNRKGPRGGVAVPFPVRLFDMLVGVEQDGLQDIVSWQPHGRCFIVKNPKKLAGDILPRYFRQSKITSFQRQLNIYGFNRLTRGTDSGGYYHPLFLRSRSELSKLIYRGCWGTNSTSRSRGSSLDEPNFYDYPPCVNLTSPPKMTEGSIVSSESEHSISDIHCDKADCDESDESDTSSIDVGEPNEIPSVTFEKFDSEHIDCASFPARCDWIPDDKWAVAYPTDDLLQLSLMVVDPFKDRPVGSPGTPMPLPPALTARDCHLRIHNPANDSFFGKEFHGLEDSAMDSLESIFFQHKN